MPPSVSMVAFCSRFPVGLSGAIKQGATGMFLVEISHCNLVLIAVGPSVSGVGPQTY